MGEEIRERVRELEGIGHARLAKPPEIGREPALCGIVRRREPGVQIVDEGGDAPPELVVARGAGLPERVAGREREVAGGVAHHRVAGLEALDALLLRVDGVPEGAEIARERIREIGDLPGGVDQPVLQPGHARDVHGEGIEVREGIRPHARDLDAPIGGELLDLPHEADGGPVVRLAAVAGEEVERASRGEQDERHDGAENDGAGLHGFSSSDSPASVLMNATIASLSSSGASRPS